MSDELEPSEELAQALKLPRSICAFALKLKGWEREPAKELLERMVAEIPGWSRMPQGVLFKQVQALSGYAPARPPTKSVQAVVPLKAIGGEHEELELDVEVHEESAEDTARHRGQRDAEEVLARGALEYRSTGKLERIPAACPACLTLRLFPMAEVPTRSCPTCGGPLVLTFSVGLAAGSEEIAYCEGFNGQVNQHIRQNIDETFNPGQLTPLAPPLEHDVHAQPTLDGERTELAMDELVAPEPVRAREEATEATEAWDHPSVDRVFELAAPPVPDDEQEPTDPNAQATAETSETHEQPENSDLGVDALFAGVMADETDPKLRPRATTDPDPDRAAPPIDEPVEHTAPDLPVQPPEEPQPELSELERAVMDAEDWRAPLEGVPFELDALMAVRHRAARDAQSDLASGVPRRLKLGALDDAASSRGDCPSCLQFWISDSPQGDPGCPECAGVLVRHAALPGDFDEANLAYQSAYNDAILAGLREQNPRLAWHLLFEAPRSVQRRLASASGLPEGVCELAVTVSAGDDAAALELLGWLKPKLTLDGRPDAELVADAQAALGEIGAEADDDEVRGRALAENELAQGNLAHHAEDPSHVCPSCLKRWPTFDAPPAACESCGSPLIHERSYVEGDAAIEAFNTRMMRQIQAELAPGFEWSAVTDG